MYYKLLLANKLGIKIRRSIASFTVLVLVSLTTLEFANGAWLDKVRANGAPLEVVDLLMERYWQNWSWSFMMKTKKSEPSARDFIEDKDFERRYLIDSPGAEIYSYSARLNQTGWDSADSCSKPKKPGDDYLSSYELDEKKFDAWWTSYVEKPCAAYKAKYQTSNDDDKLARVHLCSLIVKNNDRTKAALQNFVTMP